jgi:S1-C subfamily serine protease
VLLERRRAIFVGKGGGSLLDATGARSLIACAREVGAECPHCAGEIALGDPIMVCQTCGMVHHRACWRDFGRCGSYNCVPGRRSAPQPASSEPVLTITQSDLDRATPLSAANRSPRLAQPGSAAWTSAPARPAVRDVSRLAIASLVCALAGIPLFGAITGLVAVLLAVLGLSSIRATGQRGLGLALSGLLLGVVDVVGWVIFLGVMLSRSSPDVHFSDLPPDLSEIQKLEPPLQRAMRANVVIERGGGLAALGEMAIGSGVILQINQGEALIVTNRHVVDQDFPSENDDQRGDQLSKLGRLTVKMLGHRDGQGQVVWMAPGQIDLALVRATCPPTSHGRDTLWQKARAMKVGEMVFAIGNPYRLGWSHTQGVISQLRTQDFDSRRVRVIQIQAAINPGNSGGGLYDHDGYLIGINTWTADKRISEGIGFAMALDTLLDLAPPMLAPREAKAEVARKPPP